MTTEKINAYEIYKLYAYAKNNFTSSFMKAGSFESFHKRNDVGVFSRMVRFFKKKEIITKKRIQMFFNLNAARLDSEFYPTNLISEESLECFSVGELRYGSEKKYLHYVFQSFKTINEYCEDFEIRVSDYFKAGKIPKALSECKAGKIAEEIVVYSKCFRPSKYKNNALVFLFAKKFFGQYEIIKNRIEQNLKLQTVLEKGFDYLIKKEKNRNKSLKICT